MADEDLGSEDIGGTDTGDAAAAAAAKEAGVGDGSDATANMGGREASEGDQATGWREDWRDALAGGDENQRSRLGRFASPKAVWETYLAGEKAFKSGAGTEPFPDEGSDEDKTKWRAINGIPEEAAGYSEKMPEGFEMTEADKPYIDAFHEAAHKANVPPEVANSLMESVYGIAAQDQKGYEEQDVLDADTTAGILQDEYGKETKAAATAAVALIGTLGEEAAANFANARLPDGTALVNSPEITRWLINMAYQINPGGITAPAEGSQEATGMATEKIDLETMMADTKGPYYTDAKNEKTGMTKHQERYAEILKIEENMAKRR